MNPAESIINWVFFEIYMRGSNFGAAGDLLRTSILYEIGGCYIDHDDLCPAIVTPNALDEYYGFHHRVKPDGKRGSNVKVFPWEEEPITGFMASPPKHPFLAYYLSEMKECYKRLLESGYKCSNFIEDGSWFDYKRGIYDNGWPSFPGYTLLSTGPDRLDFCLKATSTFSLENPISTQQQDKTTFQMSAAEPRIISGFSNSWLGNPKSTPTYNIDAMKIKTEEEIFGPQKRI